MLLFKDNHKCLAVAVVVAPMNRSINGIDTVKGHNNEMLKNHRLCGALLQKSIG